MFLPLTSLQRAFRRMQKRALNSNDSIKIFVAPDCDAICAARILTILLKSEFIPYVVQPVCGYEDLSNAIEQHLNEQANTTSIVLVNCGNLMDLSEVTESNPNLTIYVFDSRRPYNMRNVDSEQIVLVDDGDASQNLPTEAYLIYQSHIQEDEGVDDADQDGDHENEGGSENEKSENEQDDSKSENSNSTDESFQSDSFQRKKKKSTIDVGQDSVNVDSAASVDETNQTETTVGISLENEGVSVEIEESQSSHDEDDGNSEQEDENENENEDSEVEDSLDRRQSEVRKRKRRSQVGDKTQDEGGVSEDESVASGTRKRPTTALESYLEDRKRAKDKQRRIDKARQILQDYYSSESYGTASSVLMYHLADQLSKKNNQLLWLGIVGLSDLYIHGRISREQYVAEASIFQARVNDLNIDTPTLLRTDEGTPVPIAEEKISFCEDYRLMLYRHWSLYESLYHSTFVASRLGIWKEQGRLRLQTFLAAMGIPLSQCQQKFSCMRSDLQAKLFEKIKTYAPTFGLEDILFGTFILNIGFKTQLSASDVVYSLCALLDCRSLKSMEQEDEEDNWKSNFWAAFDSLSRDRMDLLQSGLHLSIRIQRAVVDQGMLLLEKKAVVTAYAFRYAFLHDCRDLELFSHPLILAKLAHFLMDVHQHNKKSSKALVLAALLKSKQSYLVIGAQCAPQIGGVIKNEFGQAFRSAAELTNAQVKHDGFDSSTILVAKDDLSKFLAALQTKIKVH
eukprot:TRINITY_DN13166_c0_g1_i1.p1 TRINITY_DN13166_c0_g1~~TRINITY_DN13166_c0_g1_i1.p1  ORF type:complete len:738 (+),score=192.94 TRINITY_DN13166_c0_g1_i1:43-2256(+)